MGTNYYLLRDICQACKREGTRWHIGKSSAGWCFSLHVNPELGITDLDDLRKAWEDPTSVIEDEYGTYVSKPQMLDTITRRASVRDEADPPAGYADWNHFHVCNNSVMGPNNLLRHKLDGRHCVKHGEGTWDCITGEFS